jgi:hypothetical protein
MKSTYCEFILEKILSTSEVGPILALIAPSPLWFDLRIECIFKYNYKNWMHSFEVSMGYESVDQTTFSTWSAITLHWKCTSVNAFIPQWNIRIECILLKFHWGMKALISTLHIKSNLCFIYWVLLCFVFVFLFVF